MKYRGRQNNSHSSFLSILEKNNLSNKHLLCATITSLNKEVGRMNRLTSGYHEQPSPASALRVARVPAHVSWPGPFCFWSSWLFHLCETRIGAGAVSLLPGLQPPTAPHPHFFLLSSLAQNNVPPAHQLMRRRSWEEKEVGRTFISLLGHLAHPAFIVSMKSAFLYHRPQ